MSRLIFTIGDIAQLAGITPKTIRHYHQIGLLEEPTRDVNNYRLYSVEQLEHLQLILRLKTFGLSLQQIKAIFNANHPDELVRIVLEKHQQRIQGEISHLQNQLANIQDYLEADVNILQEWHQDTPNHSAMTILSDTIKPKSNGLSDLIVEFEGRVLAKIDRYEWAQGYDLFWLQIGKHLINHLIDNESLFIFWMERYIALKDMDEDDLQGQAWLKEMQQSQARVLLASTFQPPKASLLPEKDQEQIQKLIPALLFEEASVLQKAFLKALITP